jgi:hypothetical protein
MTDGIIQKIFNKFYTHTSPYKECKECEYAHDEVKQELIEEIDKRFNPNYFSYSSIDIRKILIGDNE